MTKPLVTQLVGAPVDAGPVEVVERKGLGHPDTICDMLAEQFSLALCKFYCDRFGSPLHHNVDKALLWGGIAKPRFGGGDVLKPFEIFIAGRATERFGGMDVPVQELMIESARAWFRQNFHALDPIRDVRLHCLVRPGSPDLVDLFLRQQRSGTWMSNDTSVGVGYAPLSELERLVYQTERWLNAPSAKERYPAVGQDIKVMGVRRGAGIDLTIGCAFIGRSIRNAAEYIDRKAEIAGLVQRFAAEESDTDITVSVNAGDAPSSVYLTVTGTSAEAGDDGQAGRGNRANGLITPARPMTMESVAGKNPVSHVGKLYNLLAGIVADALVTEVPGVAAAECLLVSRIGHPITEPQLVHIRVGVTEGELQPALSMQISDLAMDHIGRAGQLWPRVLDGSVGFDRWPLSRPS